MPNWAAVIAAAGQGTRYAPDALKQESLLAGKPVLQWSIDALRPFCAQLLVAVPPTELLRFQGKFTGVDRWVPGGLSRAESIAAAIDALEPGIDYVLIHDAARPAVTADLIHQVKAAAEQDGAAIAALPLTDTVKQVDARRVIAQTLDRDSLWVAQTPQGFSCALYRQALAAWRGGADPRLIPTDDAMLLELAGLAVVVVPGVVDNLKLTHAADRGRLEQVLTTR